MGLCGMRVSTRSTGAAQARSLLSYQRSEEQAADQSAVRYLKATVFRSNALDPYLVSHPLPAERIAQLETLAKQSPYYVRTPGHRAGGARFGAGLHELRRLADGAYPGEPRDGKPQERLARLSQGRGHHECAPAR
jgi:predicted Zn-dependent protease